MELAITIDDAGHITDVEFDTRYPPAAVIEKMVTSLERSPAAIRDFIARADERALAEGRGVTLALVREMLAEPPSLP